MAPSRTSPISTARHLDATHVRHEADAARMISNQLAGVDVSEIRERINRFCARPLEKQTDSEIKTGVSNIIFPGKGRSMAFSKSSIPVAEGATFFRGRGISDPRHGLRTIEDFWEPRPIHVRSPGRLNSSGESILYTALWDPVTVVHECRFRPGDTFAISRFVAKVPFRATFVGEDPLTPGLTPAEIEKVETIQSFLAQAFSTKVGSDNPDPYRLSRLIALEYFDLPPQLYKGWAFRSVADPRGHGWNFSFRPALGRKVLRYKETHVCRLLGFESDNRQPIAELIEVISPAKGGRLIWQPRAKLAAIKPFWSQEFPWELPTVSAIESMAENRMNCSRLTSRVVSESAPGAVAADVRP